MCFRQIPPFNFLEKSLNIVHDFDAVSLFPTLHCGLAGILQHDLDLRIVPSVMLGTSISLMSQVLCLGQV